MSAKKSTPKRATKPTPKKPTPKKPTPAPRPRATSRLTSDEESEVTKFGDQFLARQASEAEAPAKPVDPARALLWIHLASLPLLLLPDGKGGIVAHRSWNSANGYHIGPPYPVDAGDRPDDPATLAGPELAALEPLAKALAPDAPDFELLTEMAERQELAKATPETAVITSYEITEAAPPWSTEPTSSATSRPPANATSSHVDSDEPVRCSEPGCRRNYVGEKLPGWHLFVSSTTGLPVAHCHTHAKIGERMLAGQMASPRPVGRPAAVERAEELHREHRDNDIKSPTYGSVVPELDDAPARAFNETMSAIDGAIEKSKSCEMMVGGASLADAKPCGVTPTIGTNGLYRYCAPHMATVAAAGATTLVYDDVRTAIVEPPKPAKPKRESKKKPATEEPVTFPCAESPSGCLTTYLATKREANTLSGVPNPPEGWWVHEDLDGSGRAAYCPGHRAVGEARTAASRPACVYSLRPELDADPEAPPPWEQAIAMSAPLVERAPWD